MIIRNREERATALWRFVGVASIPLLLLFIAGFSLGDTSGKEKTANRKMLEKAATRLDSMENKVTQYEAFFTRTNGLLKEIEKKTGELDADLIAAAQANDVQQLILWKDKERDAFDAFEDSIRVAKRQFKDVAAETPIITGADFLEKYITSVRRRLLKQHSDLSKQLDAGQLGEMEKALAQIEQQKKEMAELGVQQGKDSELAELKADLKDCQKELALLQKGATGTGSQNEKIVAGVKTQIKTIQVEMLPKISDKTFKNDTKKLNELKMQIQNSLTGISTDLMGIK